jgi:hypothetical protein
MQRGLTATCQDSWECRLRQQQHRADSAAPFNVAVRHRRSAQRVGATDFLSDNALSDEPEQFVGRGLKRAAGAEHVMKSGARDRQRSFLSEQEQVKRRHMAGGIAVVDEHAERPHTI